MLTVLMNKRWQIDRKESLSVLPIDYQTTISRILSPIELSTINYRRNWLFKADFDIKAEFVITPQGSLLTAKIRRIFAV